MRYDVVGLTLGSISGFLTIPLSIAFLVTLVFDAPTEISHARACIAFLPAILMALAIWHVLSRVIPDEQTNARLRDREAFASVALAWPLAVVIISIPMWLSGTFHGPGTSDWASGLVHSIFESSSGVTTTGATVIDATTSPRCNVGEDCLASQLQGILLLRSASQWIGGMGVVMVGVFTLSNRFGGGMTLARAELTGPTLEKLRPRMIGTARVLWVTYLAFTLLAFLAYFAIPGLSFFEAVNHALTTAPTGGFSTSDASLSGTVSDAHIATVEWVAIVLMFIAGFNMALLVMAWDQRSLAPLVQDEEARGYTVIVVTISTLVCLGVLLWTRSNTEEAPIRSGLFTVAAIVTSTGYVAADYNAWPMAVRGLILMLMITGASAGSTAGGVKILRVLVAVKVASRELRRLVNPRRVERIRMNDEFLEDEQVSLIIGMLMVWVLVFIVSCFIMALLMPDLDLMAIISVSLSAIGNTGPSMGMVGPTGTWSQLSPSAMIFTSLLMWAGRLELLTVLMLFVNLNLWRSEPRAGPPQNNVD